MRPTLLALLAAAVLPAQASPRQPFVPPFQPGHAALTAHPSPDILRLAEWEIARQADRDLAEERALYWRKCALALKSRRDSRSHALRGVGLFLATVPLEYAVSRHRHIRKAEPVTLNAAAFVLMGATLFQLSRSYRRWEHYERDRGCCRLWQEYAKPPTAKVAAVDAPWFGPSRPSPLVQLSLDRH